MFWQAGATGAGTRPNSAAGPAKGGGTDVDAAADSHAVADHRSNSAANADHRSNSAANADLDGNCHADCGSRDCACPIQHHNTGTCSANRDAIADACSAYLDADADAGTTNRDTVADAGNVGGHRDASQNV